MYHPGDQVERAKETLRITGAGLPNEDAIWDEPDTIQNKWEEVKKVCPWFYRMRDMVEDRFDDIGAAIANSESDVHQSGGQRGSRKKYKGPVISRVEHEDGGPQRE